MEVKRYAALLNNVTINKRDAILSPLCLSILLDSMLILNKQFYSDIYPGDQMASEILSDFTFYFACCINMFISN